MVFRCGSPDPAGCTPRARELTLPAMLMTTRRSCTPRARECWTAIRENGNVACCLRTVCAIQSEEIARSAACPALTADLAITILYHPARQKGNNRRCVNVRISTIRCTEETRDIHYRTGNYGDPHRTRMVFRGGTSPTAGIAPTAHEFEDPYKRTNSASSVTIVATPPGL